MVHESVPARNLAELIAYAKANPGKLSYGSAGAGTLTNLAGELFKQLIGAPDIVHIPYKGSAPGVADLASGHIPMMTPNVGAPLLGFHRAGKVRILAVNADTRASRRRPTFRPRSKPDLPGMIAGNLNGLFAPAGVPQADRRPDRRRHPQDHGGRGFAAHPGGVRLRADPRLRARGDACVHRRGDARAGHRS